MRSRLAKIIEMAVVVALGFLLNSCGSQPFCPTCGTTVNGAYGVLNVVPGGAEAGDGLTAISEYERIKPDIVLMDITMPQMEGIEAVERIVRQHADARIVMVSSVGYQENILAALQKGAKHFVQKPVKPEVLYEILRYVLSDDPSAAGAPLALAGESRS